MKKVIYIPELPLNGLLEEDALLVNMAREAISLSYSPYSGFAVGAAVLLENGKIIKGSNQENSSYPVGICAERSALATSQNMYPNVSVIAIALAAKDIDGEYTENYITPCGMCRQVICELEQRYHSQIRILMTSKDKVAIANTINDLLPMSFN